MKANGLILGYFLLNTLAALISGRPTGTTSSGVAPRRQGRSNVRVPHEARKIIQSRQYSLKQPRNFNNDCPSTPLPSGRCTQTCPLNAVAQKDGSCACRRPFQTVTGGKCQIPCHNGFTPNADGDACECSGFKLMGEGGLRCVPTCPNGYFGDSETRWCRACPSGVTTCTSGTVATGCGKKRAPDGTEIQLYLDPILQVCVSVCSDGTFLDSILGRCSPCPAGSLTCTDANTPTTCGKSGTGVQLFLNKLLNVCVDVCGSGLFGNLLGQCESCPAGATSCTDANTPTTCGKSGTGAQLYLNGLLNACVEVCGDGLFGNLLGHCETCFAGATSCTDANTPTTCGKSATGAQLYLNGLLNACVEVCGDGLFGNLLGHCEACPTGSTSCTDANTPTACGKDPSGAQLYLNDVLKVCVAACGDGLFGNLLGKCEACPAGSTTCTDANTATSCGKDGTGAQLYLNGLGACVSVCGDGLFGSLLGKCESCGTGAKTCTDANTATSCGKSETGLQLFLNGAGVCVETCGTGLFGNLLGNTCDACGAGATHCTDAKTATVCGTSGTGVQLYLNGLNACVEVCGNGFFGDLVGVCKACPAGAATCTSTAITSCGVDGSGLQLFLNSAGVCVNVCTDGFFKNLVGNTCSPCADGVATCSGPNLGDALSCLTGSLFGGSCVTQCPAGTRRVNGACEALPTYARFANKKLLYYGIVATWTREAQCASLCSPNGGGYVDSALTCRCKDSRPLVLQQLQGVTTLLPGTCESSGFTGACDTVYYVNNQCHKVGSGAAC